METLKTAPAFLAACALAFSLLGSCTPSEAARSDASEPEGTAISSAEADGGWQISLRGAREAVLAQMDYDEAKAHETHYAELQFEKKGELHSYRAMPLRLIVAMVDGRDSEHAYRFDRDLWEQGYDITISADDGYSATFNTAEIPSDTLFLADSEDGESTVPSIIGDVSGKLWVKNVVSIELGIAPPEAMAGRDFQLVLDLNGEESTYRIEDLEASPLYVEGTGSFTTSAGTTYTNVYGGVVLADFLDQFFELGPDDTVRLVAVDGYEMPYSGEQILDESDGGKWILAFKIDGEYMPEDPGYVRTVKIGPDNPNIDGHLSVKMIERIAVEVDSYADFALVMTGKMDWTLNRQTIQSCVSCHRQTVTYDQKGEISEYTGVPLWRFLAYVDDEKIAPHKQDSSIISYSEAAVEQGYTATVVATDGFSVTLDSGDIDRNDDVILAALKQGEKLPEREWPLILVWDKDTEIVPDGIKGVRGVSEIQLATD